MNVLLGERKRRGWTRKRVATELARLMVPTDTRYPITEAQIGRWERDESHPEDYWVEKLCALYTSTAEELGLYAREPAEREPMERGAPAKHATDPASGSGTVIASQYLPRVAPTDATAPDVYGPPSDEGLLPVPEPFVGRGEELRWLMDCLRRGGVTGITAVRGIGGIGKTSLAAVAVRRLRDEGRFRDGVGVITCHGKTDAVQVLREALSRFEPQRRLPTEPTMPQLCDVAYRLLNKRDVIIVLDNVEPELDIEGIQGPLQAVKATMLMTSRIRLTVGESIDLQLLSVDQAQELFAQYYAKTSWRDLAPNDTAAVALIVEHLGRHTLAVKIAARYALGARRKLALLADELRSPQEVSAIADTIDRVFMRSLQALPLPAQHMFAAFGAFATPEFGRNAALGLAAALGIARPHALVDLLVERALVEASVLPDSATDSDVERLQLHPLLRAFAVERMRELPDEFGDAARRSIATYYAEYASRPLRAALGPDEINITEALVWAHEHGLDALITRICLGMQAFWRDYGRAGQTQKYVPWGIEAAERLVAATATHEATQGATQGAMHEAPLALATLRLAYTHFLRLTGKLTQAEDLAKLVLPTFRETGNLPGVGGTLTALGNIARDRARYEEAEAYLREALAVFRDEHVRDISGQGLVLCFLGQIAQRRGRMELAERQLQEALATYRQVGDQWGIGLALILLGRISLQRGSYDEAGALYQEALGIHQALEARRSVGADLSSLGEICLGLGQLDEAERHFLRGLANRVDSRDRRGEAVDYTFLGKLACIQGAFDESRDYLERATGVWEEVQDPRGLGWALSERAQLAIARDRPEDADELLARSLAIRRSVDDRRGEATDLRLMSERALARREIGPAETWLCQAREIVIAIQDRPEEARVCLDLALVAALRDVPDHAEALFRASLDLAAALGALYDVTRAQVALAGFLAARDRGDEARWLLARAQKQYAQMGIAIPEHARTLMLRLGCGPTG